MAIYSKKTVIDAIQWITFVITVRKEETLIEYGESWHQTIGGKT